VWIAGPPEQPRKPVTRLERPERRKRRAERANTHKEGRQLRDPIAVQVVEVAEKKKTTATAQAKAVANKPPAIPT
jgi:hypothetical protein